METGRSQSTADLNGIFIQAYDQICKRVRRRSSGTVNLPTGHFDLLDSFFDAGRSQVHHGGRALDAVIRPCNSCFRL